MDILTSDNPVFYPKYAQLTTIEAYNALNDAISDSYRYPRNATDYYSDPAPTVSSDGNYYMQITPDVQANHGECLTGVTLVDVLPVQSNEGNG